MPTTILDIPKHYVCPLINKIMAEPVFLSGDGRTYEKEAIKQWLSTNDVSPIQRQVTLASKDIYPAVGLQEEILEFLQQPPNLKYYQEDLVYLPILWKEQLSNAIKAKNKEDIDLWLSKDPNLLLIKLEQDYTVFHIACEFSSPEVVDFLLGKYSQDQLKKIMSQCPTNFKPIHLNDLLGKSLNNEPKFSFLTSIGAEISQNEVQISTRQLLKEQADKIIKQQEIISNLMRLCVNLFSLFPAQNHSIINLTPELEEYLFETVENSRQSNNLVVNATNAATILSKSRISFSGKNLQEVKIPKADLTGGIFNGTNFKQADLRGVFFKNAYLRDADLEGALMQGTVFTKINSSSDAILNSLVLSQDGQKVAITINGTNLIYICNVIANGTIFLDKQIKVKELGKLISFSHDNKKLIIENYNSRQIIDLESEEVLMSLNDSSPKHHIMFSQDDSKLIFYDSGAKIIRLWDIATNRLIALFGTTDFDLTDIRQMYVLDNNKVFLRLLHKIILLDLEQNKFITFAAISSNSDSYMIFSADNKLLAFVITSQGSSCRNDSVQVWDITGIPEASIKIFKLDKINHGYINKIGFSYDSKYLVAITTSNNLFIWDYETNVKLPEIEISFNIKKFIWNKLGLLVASCASSYEHLDSIRIWRINANVVELNSNLQLLFSFPKNQLCLKNANLTDVEGLDPEDIRILKEQGAIGNPKIPDLLKQEETKALLFSPAKSKGNILEDDPISSAKNNSNGVKIRP